MGTQQYHTQITQTQKGSPPVQRDTYRSRVYAAERTAFEQSYGARLPEGKTWNDVPWSSVVEKSWPNELGGKRIEKIPDVQAYVDKITHSAWFKRRWPFSTEVRISDGRRHRRAVSYSSGVIAMPRWARVEWVILHELAHQCNHEGAAHGWQFLQCYIELVGHVLGKDSAVALKSALWKQGVPIRAPRGKEVAFKKRLDTQRINKRYSARQIAQGRHLRKETA